MSDIKKLNVLVVEDTPGDVFLIKFYLEELDPDFYSISSADTLQGAFEQIENNSYDIILLDLHLPDSSGLDTLKRTVEAYPDQLIIILTGLSDERIGLEAVKNGAQDYLVKGRFDGAVLDSSIKYAFERFQLNRKIKQYSKDLINIQYLHQLGYFEYNFAHKTLLLSDYLKELIHISEDISSIEQFAALFDDGQNLLSAIDHIQPGETATITSTRNGSFQIDMYKKKNSSVIFGTLMKKG